MLNDGQERWIPNRCARTDEELVLITQVQEKVQNHFLRKEIDTLLRTRKVGYIEKLAACIRHPEYEMLGRNRYEMFLLKGMYELCEAEIKEGKIPVLCRLTSLEDVERIYNTTYFLLRRIERNLPVEHCVVLADWVREMELSAAFLIHIIEKGRIIYKLPTAELAAGILITEKCIPEAEKLLVWVRDEKEKKRK